MDVFNKNYHTEVPFLCRSAIFMDDIVVSKEGATKLLKGLNPSKALGYDELHPESHRSLQLNWVQFLPIFSNSLLTWMKSPKNGPLQIYVLSIKRVTGLSHVNTCITHLSYLCTSCKLLKHIVCSNLMAHLDGYRLLSDRQNAFRKKAQL